MNELENSRIDLLPLGSVVIVRGGVKKVMIIARGLATALEGGTKFFDYGGCLYPEGVIGDGLLYFNHADIQKAVYEGFVDEDEALMVENINEWVVKSGYERGNPIEINEKNRELEVAGKEALFARENEKGAIS
jgi:hypothetical protein